MAVLVFLFFALSAFSQSFQYRFEGSFTTAAGPNPATPTTVNYSVNWNETATALQGVYRDNYFSREPQVVTGTVGAAGRSFTVILPAPVYSVRQIVVTTPQVGSVSGTISTTVVTRTDVGGVVDDRPGFAMMETLPAATGGGPADVNAPCTVGFGSLTGLCGLYAGTVTEVVDSANRCDLLGQGSPRLELAPDTVFRFYTNYVPGAPNPPLHNIGAFLPSPTSTAINVPGRTCGPLPGTTFRVENCRTMNLSGLFFTAAGGGVNFTGTYSISDDATGENCSYSINVWREVVH